MGSPLEDNYTDVIQKAQQGLNLSNEDLANIAGLTVPDLVRALAGDFVEENIHKIALALHLCGNSLVSMAQGGWMPEQPQIKGLTVLHSLYHSYQGEDYLDITTNVYLVLDMLTRKTVVIDTGTDITEMVNLARTTMLKLRLLLLTHSHPDHVGAFATLKKATEAPAYMAAEELIEGVEPIRPGKKIDFGNLEVEARFTPGHSPGSMSYIVRGLPRTLVFTGDALFAGSIGRPDESFELALKSVREQIFTLPDDTVICPGHGPMSTVGEEKRFNPFFPEYKT